MNLNQVLYAALAASALLATNAHAQVEVNFENGDTKWLVLRYANLDLM